MDPNELPSRSSTPSAPSPPPRLREVEEEWFRWHDGGTPRLTWILGDKELPVFYADMTYATAVQRLRIPGKEGDVLMRCVQCNGWAGSGGQSLTVWTDGYFASCRSCNIYELEGRFVLFADGVCGEAIGSCKEND